MVQLTLIKDKFGLYDVQEFKGIPLDTLAEFLTEDGSEWIDNDDAHYEQDPFINWLNDKNPKNTWTGGNSMEMLKRGEKVYSRLAISSKSRRLFTKFFHFKRNYDQCAKTMVPHFSYEATC